MTVDVITRAAAVGRLSLIWLMNGARLGGVRVCFVNRKADRAQIFCPRRRAWYGCFQNAHYLAHLVKTGRFHA